jgi:hypothetical protein
MYNLALQLEFDRAHRRAALRDLLAFVTRRPNRLVPYHEARRRFAPGAESYRGLQSVPIARIVGSVERFDDFDRAFLPRKRHSATRWLRVARAHADGVGLPPVQLYEVGGDYFVQDGHHRISVARLNGQQFVDAEVTAASIPAAVTSPVQARSSVRRRLVSGLRSLVPGMPHGLAPSPGGASFGSVGCAAEVLPVPNG